MDEEEEQREPEDVDEQRQSPSKRREERRVAWDRQRAVLHSFAQIEGKTATEAYDHLCKAYGSGAMGKSQAYNLFKQFKEGRSEWRSQRGKFEGPRGSPRERTEANVAKIRELIEEDARCTVRYLAWESGLSFGTVRNILKKDLGFTKKCARWVPRLLTEEHKAKHLEMARDFIRRCEADPEFLDKVGYKN